MQTITLKLTGSGLGFLMHNARLADKLDPITRQKAVVTAKRKKTDEDELEVSKLEFMGGLYHDPEFGPYLPGDNVFKCLVEAARKSKDGKRVEQGVFVPNMINPLIYDGPRTVEGLWADKNFVHRTTVKQGMVRVTRTRPLFRSWATEVEVAVDENVLDVRDIENFIGTAGSYIGVGDWRPKFGRFIGEVLS